MPSLAQTIKDIEKIGGDISRVNVKSKEYWEYISQGVQHSLKKGHPKPEKNNQKN